MDLLNRAAREYNENRGVLAVDTHGELLAAGISSQEVVTRAAQILMDELEQSIE